MPLYEKRVGEKFFTKTEQSKKMAEGNIGKSIPVGLVPASTARVSLLCRKQ
jgi:hypothetical protein